MTRPVKTEHAPANGPDTTADTAQPRHVRRRETRWTNSASLLHSLGLPSDLTPTARDNPTEHFPLRVTESFRARIRQGDPNDPLLRQILPSRDELEQPPGVSPDPVGDLDSIVTPGVLKKYAGRALIVVTGACAIHCRYCFRRNFPYDELALKNGLLDDAIFAIKNDASIAEVILSGGDPLSIGNDKLARLMSKLQAIEHVKTIRLHTRIPVVEPSRIDDELLRILNRSGKRLVLVLHCNHGNEIDSDAEKSIAAMSQAFATVLNQSVLLKGINDDAPTLVSLSRRLFEVGVLPYYLHQLDPVAGASHFSVDDSKATQLLQDVSAALPGYLVPRLVREIPGEPAKTLLR